MRTDTQGRELFRVTTDDHANDGVERVTLTMDVPRTPELRRSYGSMVLLARGLGSTLGGTLQDDNGRVLDEHALSAIGTQLDTVRDYLTQHGFPPGGALALRLFS